MGLSAVADFFIAFVVVLIIVVAGWIIYTHLRARRLGLPPPTLSSYNPFSQSRSSYTGPLPAPGGLVGWVNDRIRAFKNRNSRVAGGAYEESLSSNVRGRGANRGFGPLDPDDAWDARVGTEADAYGPGSHYEEQELGLHHGAETAYGGGGLAPHGVAPLDYEEHRGRSRSREPEPYIGRSQAGLNRRYDEEIGVTGKNPFDDDQAEPSNVSLRGVSPRPIETAAPPKEEHAKDGSDTVESSAERQSMFKEDM
jgi:hypothetical protein